MLFKDHLKIVTDAGAVLHLGWDYDAPYVLDPLNGVDVDLQTGAFIGFDLTLQPDETLEIYRSTSDRLACTLTRAGVTENIFAKLDEDSTLTELQPGDNMLSMQAENGSGYLQASVSFYPMEAGILPEPL